MREPLPSRTKELQAMSRQKLQGLWGSFQSTQPLESRCFNSDSTAAGMQTVQGYILSVSVRHWHGEDTEISGVSS